eukprot:m.10725 g.10725  ORF g.10725 m.10725 type:complete len:849 (-) comp7811_c0_seq1:112-2658(-)
MMMNYVVVATAIIVGLVSVLPRYIVLWGAVGFFSGIGLVVGIAYYAFQQLYGSLNEGKHKKSLSQRTSAEGDTLQTAAAVGTDSNATNRDTDSGDDPEPCAWVNAILNFLFHELQYTVPVHQHFRNMIESDLKELREETVAGKLIERTAIVDLNLGSSMPRFCKATSTMVGARAGSNSADVLHDGHSQPVDVCFDMAYTGGAQLMLELDLVFGKHATVTVKVQELSGPMRLSLRSYPHPHYKVVFTDEPVLRCDVETVFQDREVPQFNYLLINQIKRSLVRQHTLPAAGKIRYKPLLPAPQPPHMSLTALFSPLNQRRKHGAAGDVRHAMSIHGRPLHEGDMTVRVLSIKFTASGTQHHIVRSGTYVFCTMFAWDNTVDDDAGASTTPGTSKTNTRTAASPTRRHASSDVTTTGKNEDESSTSCSDEGTENADGGGGDNPRGPQIVVDEEAKCATETGALGSERMQIIVHRQSGGGTLGMWFAPDGDHANTCKITAIQPHSPASASDLRLHDVVTHIDATPIYSARQAARVLQLAGAHVAFTVTRGRDCPACEATPAPPSLHTLSRHAHATKYIDPHAESDGIKWLDPLALSVAAGRRVLRIRLHEQKTRHGQRVGKPTVFGMCDISLDRIAIECSATNAPHVRAYALFQDDSLGSAVVGRIKVEIMHKHRAIRHQPHTGMPASSPSVSRSASVVSIPVGADGRNSTVAASQPPDTGTPASAPADCNAAPTTFSIAHTATTTSAASAPPEANSTMMSGTEVAPTTSDDVAVPGGNAAAPVSSSLEDEITTVRNNIDLEAETRSDLCVQLDNCAEDQKRRLRANIRASDDRMQYLVTHLFNLTEAQHKQ